MSQQKMKLWLRLMHSRVHCATQQSTGWVYVRRGRVESGVVLLTLLSVACFTQETQSICTNTITSKQRYIHTKSSLLSFPASSLLRSYVLQRDLLSAVRTLLCRLLLVLLLMYLQLQSSFQCYIYSNYVKKFVILLNEHS